MYPDYIREIMDKLTEEDIRTATKVLMCLESIAYAKMTTDKAIRYCEKVQTIENDVRHIFEMIQYSDRVYNTKLLYTPL